MEANALLKGLRDAKECLRIRKDRGYTERLRVGVIRREVSGLVVVFREGEVILFEPYDNGKRCVVERPYSADEIAAQHSRGSGLTTGNPMVGVPMEYIEEIDVSDW